MSETTLKRIIISKHGQITLSRKVQTLLGIKKGDQLVLAIKNKKLVIQKASNLEKPMESDFKDLVMLSDETAKKLWDNKYDEIWNKV